jgi:hypothetical protein
MIDDDIVAEMQRQVRLHIELRNEIEKATGQKMNRADILDAVKKTICQDRQDVHGNPEDTHELIGGFWTDYLKARGWSVENSDGMVSAQDVAVMMTLFKVARHAMNPRHADNLHDLIGYAAIAAELGAKNENLV